MDEAQTAKAVTPYAKDQMAQLLELFELGSDFYGKLNKVPTKAAVKTLRAGDKIIKALNLGSSK